MISILEYIKLYKILTDKKNVIRTLNFHISQFIFLTFFKFIIDSTH